MTPKIEWVGEWFSSPYYHILYKNRDSNEARLFLDKLIDYLNIKKKDKILDPPCHIFKSERARCDRFRYMPGKYSGSAGS
jgi:hypothetical protein